MALVGASQQFRAGNRESFNRFLRLRVVAQGVTIAACVIGSTIYAKEAATQKVVAREEELEKIRTAGSRSAAAENALKAENFSEPNEPSNTDTSSNPSPPPPPPAPTTTEELWKRWGVKNGGKS